MTSSHSFSHSHSAAQHDDHEDSKSSTPGFLLKTFKMVSDPSTNHLVSWNEKGDGFIVKNEHEFATQVLPAYFRHKNFSSFVRQLNFYGFKKRSNKNSLSQFSHPQFLRGQVDKLKLIHRKTPDASLSSNVKEAIASLQSQVSELKDQYDHIWKIQHQILFILSQFVRGSPEVQSLLSNTQGPKRRLLPQQPAGRLPKRRQLLVGNSEEDSAAVVDDETSHTNLLSELAQMQEMVESMPNGSAVLQNTPFQNLLPNANVATNSSSSSSSGRTPKRLSGSVSSPAFGYSSMSAPPFQGDDVNAQVTRFPSQGVSITEILPDSEPLMLDRGSSQWDSWQPTLSNSGSRSPISLTAPIPPPPPPPTPSSSLPLLDPLDGDEMLLAPPPQTESLFDINAFGLQPLPSINSSAAPPFSVPSSVSSQFPFQSSSSSTSFAS